MEKNRLLLFLFSFIPGAGQMYLNMMKKGMVLMSLFCGVAFCAAFFYFEWLLFLLPVIWFYSFFDAINSGHLTYEERLAADKTFFTDIDHMFSSDMSGILEKSHLFLGAILVLAGIYLLFNNVFGNLIWRLDDYLPGLHGIFHKFPTLLVAIFIIVWGIRLVKGGKKPEAPTDFKEYEGDKHE